MTPSLQDIIRDHLRPLEPIPTGESPVLQDLPDVRVVLFDVYGTLIISASGDVGTAGRQAEADAFTEALQSAGVTEGIDGEGGVRCLMQTIADDHEKRKLAGADYPEVDIVDVWRQTLARLIDEGKLPAAVRAIDPHELAVQYEMRVNAVWPMPEAQECLALLTESGRTLGLVSNAQFFTLELFPALFGHELAGLGFDAGLQYYSYRHGRAKPGRFLYDLAAEELHQRGIGPADVLYVGNDLLNDVTPAAAVGFRTALFAGDARSLRRREGDPRVAGVQPDLVVTDLLQLLQCVR